MATVYRETPSPPPELPHYKLNASMVEDIFFSLVYAQNHHHVDQDDAYKFKDIYRFVLAGTEPFHQWHAILARSNMTVLVNEKICVHLKSDTVFTFVLNAVAPRCVYSLMHLAKNIKNLTVFHIVQPFFDFLYYKSYKVVTQLQSVHWMSLDSVPLKSLMMSLRVVHTLITDVNTLIACNFPTNRTPHINVLSVYCINMKQVLTLLSILHCHFNELHLHFPVFNWEETESFFNENKPVFYTVTYLTISAEVQGVNEYLFNFITNISKMFPRLTVLNIHFRVYNRLVQPLERYDIESVVNELNTLMLMVKHVLPPAKLVIKFHRFDVFRAPPNDSVAKHMQRIEDFIHLTNLDPLPDKRCFCMRSFITAPAQKNSDGCDVGEKKIYYVVSLYEENSEYPANIVSTFDESELFVERNILGKRRKIPKF